MQGKTGLNLIPSHIIMIILQLGFEKKMKKAFDHMMDIIIMIIKATSCKLVKYMISQQILIIHE
jgi:hypothetical protein